MRRTGFLPVLALLAALTLLSPSILTQPAPEPPRGTGDGPMPQWTEVLAIQELVRQLEAKAVHVYLTDPRSVRDLRLVIEKAIGEIPVPPIICMEQGQQRRCPKGYVCCNGVCQPTCGPGVEGTPRVPGPSLPGGPITPPSPLPSPPPG